MVVVVVEEGTQRPPQRVILFEDEDDEDCGVKANCRSSLDYSTMHKSYAPSGEGFE